MSEYFGIFFGELNVSKKVINEFSYMERRCWALACLLIAVLLFFAQGCSPTGRIAKAATSINEAASSSKNRFTFIESEASSPTPDAALIKEQSIEGQKEQDYILSYVFDIQHSLTSVEDKIPYWMTLASYGLIVLGILAVCWLLWHTGIGTLIKGIVGFVPRAKVNEADLAASVLNDSSPATMREFIAARRASDREFDRAYERATTKRDRTIC